MYNDLLFERLAAIHEAEQDERIHELIEEIESLDSLLSPEAQLLIRDLRPHTVTDDVYEDIDEKASLGDHLADQLATLAGSWRFILSFCGIMGAWILANLFLKERSFDPYPFILLNLVLSTLAGLQAPVILMAQNRQSEKDRAVAQNDYHVNLKNELEIADIHRKIDTISETMTIQTQLINALVSARRQELSATIRAIENARREP